MAPSKKMVDDELDRRLPREQLPHRHKQRSCHLPRPRYRSIVVVVGLTLWAVIFNVPRTKLIMDSSATTTLDATAAVQQQQQPTQPQDGRIQLIDSIMYNGEDILLPRITMLYDSVDHFYISESNLTFSGERKSLYSLQVTPLLEKYLDKITWVIYDEARDPRGPCKGAWEREARQREYAVQQIREDHEAGVLRDDFVILHTDLDELPDPAVLAEFHTGGKYHDVVTNQPTSLVMRLFYYNFHWAKRGLWMKGHTLPGLMVLKRTYSMTDFRKNQRAIPHIPDAGWHASYFGDVDFIIRKIEGFSHQELNMPRFKAREYIKECFATGKDLYFRSGAEVMDWFNYTTLPVPLQDFHRQICAKQGVDPDLPPPNLHPVQ